MQSKRIKGFLAISGPTGSGKNVVIPELLEKFPVLKEVTTMTTRPRRLGERTGREYHFVSKEEFRRHIRHGYFLEWAIVHENYYGTPRRQIEAMQRKGRIPVLDIDVQGGIAVKKIYPDALLVFIHPTPWKKYVARLQHDRGHELNFRARIKSIAFELRMASRYDCIVKNREGALPKTIAHIKQRIARYVRRIRLSS
ncbi:MAG: guanylate kinase [bacterium]|nr:guanylate kinase [bacterium]